MAAVVSAAAGGALLVVPGESSPDVVVAGKPSQSGASERDSVASEGSERDGTAVSLRMIEVHTGLNGGEDVVFVFDGQLPDNRVTYVEDIKAFAAPGLAYAVQNPAEFWVCEDVHWNPGARTGSIDVLIPSEWSASGAPVHEVPKQQVPHATKGDSVDSPGKIVGCGPHNGYVQYSIWAPASDDPGDIRVSVQGDSTRLVVEVRPEHG